MRNLGYGACRSAALSAFLKVDNRHSFFIFMRDAIVQLCCCAFCKSFLTGPIGSSQEPTLRATIAILGNVSSRQLLLQNIRNVCKLLDEGVTTYQERLASHWTMILQRIKNVLQVTGRRCYNVSGTSCKVLDDDVTTYQERLASYWTKMLQVSGTSCKVLIRCNIIVQYLARRS